MVWDLGVINSGHQGICTSQHVTREEEWVEPNITMQADWGGGLYGAQLFITLVLYTYSTLFTHQIYSNKFWTSPHDYPISVNTVVHRTPCRLPSVTKFDYTCLYGHTWRQTQLLKKSFGNSRCYASQEVYGEQDQLFSPVFSSTEGQKLLWATTVCYSNNSHNANSHHIHNIKNS